MIYYRAMATNTEHAEYPSLCDRDPDDLRVFAGARVCDRCGWARQHHNRPTRYVIRVGTAYLGQRDVGAPLRPVNRPFAYEFELRRHAEFHAEAYARQARPDAEIAVEEVA